MKKFFYSIACFIAILTLTACGNKKAITTDKFKNEAEAKGWLKRT